jgi:hypothetical protein
MLVLGDVIATVALVLFTAVAGFATILLASLLFPVRAEAAARRIESRPYLSFVLGLVIGVPVIVIGLVLLNVPSPAVKFIGFVVLLVLLLMGTLGLAGLARILGQRLQGLTGRIGSANGQAAGSLLIMGACLMPLVGQFVVLPLVLLVGLGGIFGAMRVNRTAQVVTPEVQ